MSMLLPQASRRILEEAEEGDTIPLARVNLNGPAAWRKYCDKAVNELQVKRTVGQKAVLVSLDRSPKFNGTHVRIDGYEAQRDRWICRTQERVEHEQGAKTYKCRRRNLAVDNAAASERMQYAQEAMAMRVAEGAQHPPTPTAVTRSEAVVGKGRKQGTGQLSSPDGARDENDEPNDVWTQENTRNGAADRRAARQRHQQH